MEVCWSEFTAIWWAEFLFLKGLHSHFLCSFSVGVFGVIFRVELERNLSSFPERIFSGISSS